MKILWKMEDLLLRSKCSIYHNILKNLTFQKAFVWIKGSRIWENFSFLLISMNNYYIVDYLIAALLWYSNTKPSFVIMFMNNSSILVFMLILFHVYANGLNTYFNMSCYYVRVSIQCIPFIMLCLASIGMDHVIIELCYRGKFYKGIIGKWPFYGHFSIIPLKNSHNKKNWEPQHTLLKIFKGTLRVLPLTAIQMHL